MNNKPDNNNVLGKRLKFLREQWQQSLHDVCNTLEIDEKTLRAYEAGKKSPSPEILDMLISHFLLTEDQAQDLRELAEDQFERTSKAGSIEEVFSKQIAVFMPIDNRVLYTDSMQATVADNGVVMQFMQQDSGGKQLPISRLGMTRKHAERVIEVLQTTLKQYDENSKNKP